MLFFCYDGLDIYLISIFGEFSSINKGKIDRKISVSSTKQGFAEPLSLRIKIIICGEGNE